MITEAYNIRVTALSPISHSEGVFGNIANFRRQKYVLSDGSVVSLPLVSGNAMRNGLRRAAMWHAISILGDDVKLGKTAINLLFSGGTLDSASPNVDVAQYKKLRHIFPPLGLFGGGIGNALVPGCLRVGPLVPVCEETTLLARSPVPKEILPSGFAPAPIAQYTDSFMGTRRELFGSPKFQALLTEGEAAQADQRLLDGKRAREKGEHPEKRDSQQMIYEGEVLAAGTIFYWRVGIQQATEEERACFLSALALYSGDATVGGKLGTGFGRLKLEAKGLHTMSPTIESTLPAFTVGDTYERHLRSNAEAILVWLKEMN